MPVRARGHTYYCPWVSWGEPVSGDSKVPERTQSCRIRIPHCPADLGLHCSQPDISSRPGAFRSQPQFPLCEAGSGWSQGSSVFQLGGFRVLSAQGPNGPWQVDSPSRRIPTRGHLPSGSAVLALRRPVPTGLPLFSLSLVQGCPYQRGCHPAWHWPAWQPELWSLPALADLGCTTCQPPASLSLHGLVPPRPPGYSGVYHGAGFAAAAPAACPPAGWSQAAFGAQRAPAICLPARPLLCPRICRLVVEVSLPQTLLSSCLHFTPLCPPPAARRPQHVW